MSILKVYGEKAWLCQALYSKRNADANFYKLVFIGVKESVKATIAGVLGYKRFVDVEELGYMYPTPQLPLKILYSAQLRQGAPYITGSIYHPDGMANIVVGNSIKMLHKQATPIFKRQLEFPILEEWTPLLWKIAVRQGYATKLGTYGLGEQQAYHIELPSSDTMMEHVMAHITPFYKVAANVQKRTACL